MYYPSSQIVPNLSTSGKEFIVASTKKEYVGFYYKTSSGQYYTGKSPQSPPNLKLTRVDFNAPNYLDLNLEEIEYGSSPTSPTLLNTRGQSLNNIQVNSTIIPEEENYPYKSVTNAPVSSTPFPTEEDYTIGEFQRYFLKKRNENLYLEVNNTTFNNYVNQVPEVQWALYLPIQLPWDLDGSLDNVYNTNKNMVLLREVNLKIRGFVEYFNDFFTRYYRFGKDENLYTSGNEFINKRTGLNYVGFYHISNLGKILVGKQSTLPNVDVLIPIDREVGTSRRQNIPFNPNSLKRK